MGRRWRQHLARGLHQAVRTRQRLHRQDGRGAEPRGRAALPGGGRPVQPGAGHLFRGDRALQCRPHRELRRQAAARHRRRRPEVPDQGQGRPPCRPAGLLHLLRHRLQHRPRQGRGLRLVAGPRRSEVEGQAVGDAAGLSRALRRGDHGQGDGRQREGHRAGLQAAREDRAERAGDLHLARSHEHAADARRGGGRAVLRLARLGAAPPGRHQRRHRDPQGRRADAALRGGRSRRAPRTRTSRWSG